MEQGTVQEAGGGDRTFRIQTLHGKRDAVGNVLIEGTQSLRRDGGVVVGLRLCRTDALQLAAMIQQLLAKENLI